MKMWSICDSSPSVRSPTPLPASIRMSLSTRNEVVRRCRPPIPPEHPRTRRRMPGLLLGERRHAVPVRRWRVAAPFSHFLGIHPVKTAAGIRALQIDEAHIGLVPVRGAVVAQRLVPKLELILRIPIDLRLQAKRLVHGHCLVLPLDPDAVDLAECDAFDEIARRLAH